MQEENVNEDERDDSQTDNEENNFGEESQGNFKQWLQDNLRIILSVIVVIAIAGGIYSYSKRAPQTDNSSDIASQIETEEQENGETAKDEAETSLTEEEKNKEEVGNTAENKEEKKAEKETEKVSTTQTQKLSQETDKSFIETAQRGEGLTHLARHALSDYLEKNPDSELKAEQKIYIEDYLRKHVGFNKRIYQGTSVEFSKDLIKDAINHSKQLNDAQIKNLHKYVVRVPSLQ